MSNKLALELLFKNRNELVQLKRKMLTRYNKEIQEIESAIESLAGKKVWQIEGDIAYDDESPDYIKGSFEE